MTGHMPAGFKNFAAGTKVPWVLRPAPQSPSAQLAAFVSTKLWAHLGLASGGCVAYALESGAHDCRQTSDAQLKPEALP